MGNIDENQKVDITPNFKKNKFPKYIFLILSVVVILIIIVVEFNVYLKSRNANNRVLAPLKKPLSSLEIVKQTLTWVDKQRDSRGVYTIGSICDGTGCDYTIPSNRSAFSVLWARNRLINKSNEMKEKEIFLKDLGNYLDESKVKEIQPNFWNCVFMYQILKEGAWSDEVNNKINNVCLKSDYESFYYVPLTNEELKKKLNENIIGLIEKKEEIFNEIEAGEVSGDQQSFMEDPAEEIKRKYFYLSADRITNFILSGSKNDSLLKESLIDMNLSLDEYIKNQKELKAYEGCYMGVTSLLMNDYNKDEIYNDLAKLVFEQQLKKMDIKSEKDSSICGFLGDMLYKKTANENYKNKVKEITQYWKSNNYDDVGGGFFTRDDGKIVKKVKFNGIFSGLLLE